VRGEKRQDQHEQQQDRPADDNGRDDQWYADDRG